MDKTRDIVKRAAFDGFDGTEVPMIWSHQWDALPLGKGTIHVEPKQAVFAGAFHLQTQHSRDAYETVKAMGGLQEYSWAFNVAPDGAEMDEQEDGPVRIITKLDRIFEVSPVLVGAGEGTRTLAIKSLADDLKAGRVSRTRIQTAIDVLTALLGADPDPAPADDPPADDDAGRAGSKDAAPPPANTVAPVADLTPLSEALVTALRAYHAALTQADGPAVRAALDWLASAEARLAETHRTLQDRLRQAKAADDLTLPELLAQFRRQEAQLGHIVGGVNAIAR